MHLEALELLLFTGGGNKSSFQVSQIVVCKSAHYADNRGIVLVLVCRSRIVYGVFFIIYFLITLNSPALRLHKQTLFITDAVRKLVAAAVSHMDWITPGLRRTLESGV